MVITTYILLVFIMLLSAVKASTGGNTKDINKEKENSDPPAFPGELFGGREEREDIKKRLVSLLVFLFSLIATLVLLKSR